jgi:hypothetical protein
MKSHRHTSYEHRLEELGQELRKLKSFATKKPQETIKVYSSDELICVGMTDRNWHRIVCKYEGDQCIGTPNPHWTSHWAFNEKGYSLEGFLDQNWKGWHGQYSTSELRYDELDFKLVKRHSDKMHEFIRDLGLYFPCHIYNGVTGDLYRP